MKLKNNNKKTAILFFLMFIIISIVGCKKFIEVEAPYTSFNGENVYTTDATAISAVTAMYTQLGIAAPGLTTRIPFVSVATSLSSDELTVSNGVSGLFAGYYTNSLVSATPPPYWSIFYQHIYLANAAIEGLNKSTSLTPAVKQQLLGEAKVMRAFCYFYLVNLYGDVPLVLTITYKTNSLMSRTEESKVWKQIIDDLNEARNLLNSSYVESDVITSKATTERIRPNKSTATALLARAYLYTGDYSNAEILASEVINNPSFTMSTPLNNVFLKTNSSNSAEAIWQVQPVSEGRNTNEALLFILPSTGPNASSYPVYINKRLVNSFEAGDIRKTAWLDSVKVGIDTFYYAHKYKSATLNAPVTEYNTVFRLAEQYLIRAEARANLNKIPEAQADLNIIRNRAGLGNTTAGNKNDLITAILRERRSELFTEWGHRWFDLKRTNTIDAVMNIETALKGGIWQTTDKLFPIANDELIANPNLVQTPGY